MVLWRDFQESLAAFWLRLGRGGFWLRAVGAQKDKLESRLRQAVLSRLLLPYLTRYDATAIALTASDRRMVQGTVESDAAFVARLRDAFDEWSRAGTALKVVELAANEAQSVVGGYDTYLVESNGRWWSAGFGGMVNTLGLDSTAEPYQWGNVREWNAFAVIFFVNTSSYGPGGFPDGTQYDRLRGIVRDWKAGHSRCVRFIVLGAATDVWGGLEDWASPGPRLTWNGAGAPSSPGAGVKWGNTTASNQPEFWAGVQE